MLCFPANEYSNRSHSLISDLRWDLWAPPTLDDTVQCDLIVVRQRLITMLCETKLCMGNFSRSLSHHTNELSFQRLLVSIRFTKKLNPFERYGYAVTREVCIHTLQWECARAQVLSARHRNPYCNNFADDAFKMDRLSGVVRDGRTDGHLVNYTICWFLNPLWSF